MDGAKLTADSIARHAMESLSYQKRAAIEEAADYYEPQLDALRVDVKKLADENLRLIKYAGALEGLCEGLAKHQAHPDETWRHIMQAAKTVMWEDANNGV